MAANADAIDKLRSSSSGPSADTQLEGAQLPRLPDYELFERIGVGGMGEVYLGRQRSVGRRVAIKLFRDSCAAQTEQRRARFEREGQLLSELSHPNILAMLDRGSVQGCGFLVTEYVEGGSLRDRLTPGRPMAIRMARPILQALGEAVKYLHEHGILHRDLKPDNVLFDAQGQLKVSDFGIAVAREDIGVLTLASQYVGTLDYMAPEQRHRLDVDERADQYSLAVVAYEMLTGERPLGVFKRPSELNPLLTEQVDSVLRRALQRDPDDRFATIDQLVAALDEALAEAPARKRRQYAGLVALLLLFVIAAGLASYRWSRRLPVPVTPVVLTVPLPAKTPFSATAATQYQQQWSGYLQTDTHYVNGVGMDMVLIPPGEFLMGSPATVIEWIREVKDEGWHEYWGPRLASEVPERHVVVDRPFYLCAAETTVGQFRQFVEATGYRTDLEGSDNGSGWREGDWHSGPQFSWQNLGEIALDGEYPVVNVSHADAVAFCTWLSEREQMEYRLPSDAEWEYACRAGTTTRWSCGDDKQLLSTFAWFGDNANNTIHVVGQLRPNGFGLFDMHGNVWEWCSGWFVTDTDGTHASPDSADGRPAGVSLLRGGAFIAEPTEARSACREWCGSNYGTFKAGFRVARSVHLPRHR